MDSPHSRVLFLCTGNYYRSRFAEHLFNHYAAENRLHWQAFSRGLAIELVGKDAGPISKATLAALRDRGIQLEEKIRSPISLSDKDLRDAHHVVALKHAEHFPLMTQKFPAWAERIEYWHVHDIDVASPVDALPEIEVAVQDLFNRLKNQGR